MELVKMNEESVPLTLLHLFYLNQVKNKQINSVEQLKNEMERVGEERKKTIEQVKEVLNNREGKTNRLIQPKENKEEKGEGEPGEGQYTEEQIGDLYLSSYCGPRLLPFLHHFQSINQSFSSLSALQQACKLYYFSSSLSSSPLERLELSPIACTLKKELFLLVSSLLHRFPSFSSLSPWEIVHQLFERTGGG